MSDSVKSTIDQVAVAIAEKRFEDAIRSCEAQLEKTPGNVLVLCKLADAALRSGDAKRSTKTYEKAIEKDPEYGWAHYGLGVALSRQRMHEAALSQFDLARACAKGKVPDETLERAIGAEEKKKTAPKPASKQSDSSNEIVQAGSKLMAAGWLAEAIKTFEEAINNGKASAAVHTRLGDAKLRSKDIQGAQTAYMAAIDIDPDFAWGHYGLACVLSKQLKWSQADDAYAKAQELAPDNALFATSKEEASKTRLLEEANALIEAGKFDEGMSMLRKLIGMDPQHAVARERLRSAAFQENAQIDSEEGDNSALFYRRELDAFRQHLDTIENELSEHS